MEKSRFSHTKGGLCLLIAFLFLCLPFFLQPAVCRQTEGGWLVVIYIHSLALLCCKKGLNGCMCVCLLCKVVNASDFQNSYPSNHTGRKVFNKSTKVFLKREFKSSPQRWQVNKAQRSTGFYPRGSIKVDCLLGYDFTCPCVHWATEILSLLYTDAALSCSDLPC